MTDEERDHLRGQQDRLIALAERCGVDRDTRLVGHAGPTVTDLRYALYPQWRPQIEAAVMSLTARRGE